MIGPENKATPAPGMLVGVDVEVVIADQVIMLTKKPLPRSKVFWRVPGHIITFMNIPYMIIHEHTLMNTS
jgi:hypothetical protein